MQAKRLNSISETLDASRANPSSRGAGNPAWFAAAVALLATVGARGQIPVTAVISRGQPTSNGVLTVVRPLTTPMIDQEGRIAVTASLEDQMHQPAEGLLVRANQFGSQTLPSVDPQLFTPALRGRTAQGLFDDARLDRFESINLRRGRIAFRATLLGPSVTAINDRAMLASDQLGRVAVVARKGDAAPGTAGGLLELTNPALSSLGGFTFASRTLAPISGTRLLLAEGLPMGLMVRAVSGAAMSGTLATLSTFGSVSEPVLLSTAGKLRLRGDILWPSGDVGEGIVSEDSNGALRLAVRTGGSLVLPDGNLALGSVRLLSSNSAGDLLFTVRSPDSTGAFPNDAALVLRSSTGQFSVLARQRRAAPGVSDAATFDIALLVPGFSAVNTNPSISGLVNSKAVVAFVAYLQGGSVEPPTCCTGTNDCGLWLAAPSLGAPVTKIARVGDMHPELPAGTTLISPFKLIGANGRNTIVFETGWKAANGADSGRALWFFRPGCGMRLITRTGAPSPRNDSPFPFTVANFQVGINGAVSGGDDGRPLVLNDQDRLCFNLSDTCSFPVSISRTSVVLANLSGDCSAAMMAYRP